MRFFSALVLLTVLCIASTAQQKSSLLPADATTSKFTAVQEYDPKRDAASDIAAAVAEAARTKRNVMVEVGGKWCVWCGYFDKFFQQNATLRTFRDENYVMVKVNFSPENENKPTLSKYPNIPGYPHIFILGPDGKLLKSQDTSVLEEGRGYSTVAVSKFLQEWAPKQ